MPDTESAAEPSEYWPGVRVDWNSPVVEAKLHVELPFWIAAPDGQVRIRVGDCSLDISYRNNIIGVYGDGVFLRNERNLRQITAVGFPFAKEQADDLATAPHGFRHFRTMLTIPVRCHSSVFHLLSSGVESNIHDARIYVRSLSHAAIRFINEFVTAYRYSSFDPFVSHLSHWDLPVWHISDAANNLWHVSMAGYPVAETLPAADPHGKYRYRTTVGRIREAALKPQSTSLNELLDAWTCFYRGQFAEAIRKSVTAIEVAISDLLAALPSFAQNRSPADVKVHLAKLRFSDQWSIYLRETQRIPPGPLTHMAPEVNGLYLERELESARERRHKIVHESEQVDYEQDGPILRILETMSWLHGWLHEGRSDVDPTGSAWHSANRQMRSVFPLEPIADDRGLALLPPLHTRSESEDVFIEDVHKTKLLKSASREELDISFCIAWAFETQQERLIHGRPSRHHAGQSEKCWLRDGDQIRPIFEVDTRGILDSSLINAIACRMLSLKAKVGACGDPLIVVNHLSQIDDQERSKVECVHDYLKPILHELRFTVISLLDWVSFVSLMTLDHDREFGFRAALRARGLVRFCPECLSPVGYIRRVFRKAGVASIVIEKGCLSVGDEICIQNGCDTRTAVITSLEVNRVGYSTVFPGAVVGAKLNSGVRTIRSDSLVTRVIRPLLTLDPSVKSTFELKERDRLEWLKSLGPFPASFTSYGMYEIDHEIG